MVADPVLGVVQQGLRLRRAPAAHAGPEAHDREPALRAADPVGIDRRGRACDRAGRALGLGLGDHQRARRPDRGQRRALGYAMAAGRREHHLGRIGEPVRFRLQLGRGEQPQRHAERVRQRTHRAARPPSARSRRCRRSPPAPGRARASVVATSSRTSSAVVPRSQPTPSARILGWITRWSSRARPRPGRSRVTLSIAGRGERRAARGQPVGIAGLDAQARPGGHRAARP